MINIRRIFKSDFLSRQNNDKKWASRAVDEYSLQTSFVITFHTSRLCIKPQSYHYFNATKTIMLSWSVVASSKEYNDLWRSWSVLKIDKTNSVRLLGCVYYNGHHKYLFRVASIFSLLPNSRHGHIPLESHVNPIYTRTAYKGRMHVINLPGFFF